MPFPHIIDNSMREAWVKCPHYFYRKYFQGYDYKTPSVHLHAGAAYAKGLEVMRREFYDNGLSEQDAKLAGARALLDAYGDFETDTSKTAEGMLSALDYYVETFPLATDYIQPHRSGGVSNLEFTFALPLPINHPDTNQPIIYAGRFDMLAELNGQLCIYDDKTASQLGKTWSSRWQLASQMTGYVWAAQQFGFATDVFVVRGISITASGNHGNEEYIGYRPQWMIERWFAQLLDEVNAMLAAYHTNKWHLNQSSSCSTYGGCELLSVCTSPNPQSWLDANFTIREYNPLNVGD